MKDFLRNKWIGILIVAAGLAAAGAAALIFNRVTANQAWDYVRLEAGAPLPQPEDFLMKETEDASFQSRVSYIDTTVPGDYAVEVAVGDDIFRSTLQIRDSIYPEGAAKPVTLNLGQICRLEDFLDWAWDATGIHLSYKNGEPDFSLVGDQPVSLLLTDSAGQTTELVTNLHIINDTVPPVIEGVQDHTIQLGDTISYKQGVTVTDDQDPDVTLTIDNSQVDMENPGVYPVIYHAEDSAGNVTEIQSTVRILPQDEDADRYQEMVTLADEVLAEILTDDMTDVEKLRAMFDYVSYNVGYTGYSDKSSWVDEAIRGFEESDGDCFTYFSMMKVLMEEAGFSTVDVEREGGSTRHYWSLVQVDGNWYHIDACPRSRYKEWVSFLRSDSEVAEFSEYYRNYYNFDHEGKPATPEHGLTEDPRGWNYG